MRCIVALTILFGMTSGLCPERKLKVRQAHTETLFTGKWKTVYLTPSEVDRRLACKTDTYNSSSTGEVQTYSYAFNASCEGTLWEARGSVFFPAPGRFNVVTEQGEADRTYWILGTDYTNYLILYSCLHRKYDDIGLCWIQSRESFLKAEMHHRVSSILKKNDFKWEDFVPMPQNYCERL